jgi:hypothetical protein
MAREISAKRPAKEIKVRCAPILNDKEIVSLVEDSSSPTAAFDMVLAQTGNSEKAKQARWLAVLRRDHPDTYLKTINNQTSMPSCQ